MNLFELSKFNRSLKPKISQTKVCNLEFPSSGGVAKIQRIFDGVV